MKKKKRILGIVTAMLMVIALAFTGCGQQGEQNAGATGSESQNGTTAVDGGKNEGEVTAEPEGPDVGQVDNRKPVQDTDGNYIYTITVDGVQAEVKTCINVWDYITDDTPYNRVDLSGMAESLGWRSTGVTGMLGLRFDREDGIIVGLAGTYTALFGPYGYATPDALAALRVRQTPYKTFGGITAAYFYRVASILSVGVAFTYAGLYGDILDAVTRRKIASDNTTTLSASAALRLQWLNRPLVRCYSSLAMGPAVDIRSLNHSREGYITLSATIAGVSVGRRLYGFGEIGAGAQGIFSAGIGYRF